MHVVHVVVVVVRVATTTMTTMTTPWWSGEPVPASPRRCSFCRQGSVVPASQALKPTVGVRGLRVCGGGLRAVAPHVGTAKATTAAATTTTTTTTAAAATVREVVVGAVVVVVVVVVVVAVTCGRHMHRSGGKLGLAVHAMSVTASTHPTGAQQQHSNNVTAATQSGLGGWVVGLGGRLGGGRAVHSRQNDGTRANKQARTGCCRPDEASS